MRNLILVLAFVSANLFATSTQVAPVYVRKTDGTLYGSCDVNGLWTLGASGGTQGHAVNGNLNISGITNIADGAVNNPALTWAAGNQLGLYRVGTAVLGVSAAGAQAAQFNASGVGFGGGTTSDSNLGTISTVTLGAYYVGTFSVTWQGALTSTKTINYVKIGRNVQLEIPLTTGTAGSTANIASAAGAIPSSLRPNNDSKFAIDGVSNGGSDGTSSLLVSNAGTITVFATPAGGNFSSGNACGWDRALQISYFSAN